MFTLGDRLLDDVVGGGVPILGITEIVGEAGMGKTQLGMQHALHVQLPPSLSGLGKAAIYIYSKGPFPTKRLHQMSECFARKYKLDYDPMDKINIARPFTWEQFVQLLQKPASEPGIQCLPSLMATKDVGLIIVDSIAGYFRTFGLANPNYRERLRVLCRVRSLLLKYAGTAVVVINEVSTAIQNGGINVPTLTRQWRGQVSRSYWMTRSSADASRRFEFAKMSVPIIICEEGVRAEDPPDSGDIVVANAVY